MLTLPAELLNLIVTFAPLFSKPVFEHAKLLLVGAILSIGKRTVTSCLRVMGLAQEKSFQNYHRVLNRARWSALAASRLLLRLLVAVFAPTGEFVCGLDDTIERRRGQQIKAKGIYRDPVRSSHSHFVKASGLRWLCAMLLVEVSWAGGVWGLPFLTALCPSQRYYKQRGRPHKKLTERAATDAAAMELVGDCAQHAGAAGVVLAGDLAGRRIDEGAQPGSTQGSLVRENKADLRRCDSERQTMFVEQLPFSNIGCK